MANADSDTSISIAGMAVKAAEDFYINNPDAVVRNRYLNATPEKRDEYIDIRYRNSPERAAEIMKNESLLAQAKRPGFPNFYTETSGAHTNTYQYYGKILQGSATVRGAFLYYDGSGVITNLTNRYDYQWFSTQSWASAPPPYLDGDITVVTVIMQNSVQLQNGYSLRGHKNPDGTFVAVVQNDRKQIILTVQIESPTTSGYQDSYIGTDGAWHYRANNRDYTATTNIDGTTTVVAGRKSYTFASGSQIKATGSVLIVSKMQDNGSVTPLASITLDPNGDANIITLSEKKAYTEFDTNRIQLSEVAQVYGGYGAAIGSALSSFISSNDKVGGVIYSSLLGQIGKGLAIALSGNAADFGSFFRGENINIVNNFAGGLGANIVSGGVGILSSTLTLDLANQLGIKGFGAELLSTVASSTSSAVVTQVLNNLSAGQNAFWGFSGQTAFKEGAQLSTTNLNNVAVGAIGSFLGAKLGSLIVQPKTQAGAVLSSLGSAVGSLAALSGHLGFGAVAGSLGLNAGSLAFNFIMPGIGTFVGVILGALIGNLFGRKAPKVPTASAETILQLPYARYEVGSATTTNGGSLNLVNNMAVTARDILNGLIIQITHGNEKSFVSNFSGNTTTQVYGHSGNQLYVKINGVKKDVISADQAVEYGVIKGVKGTKIVGGDIFLKRAILSSLSDDLISLMGDLSTAADFYTYRLNSGLINSYIKDAYASLTDAEKALYAKYKNVFDTALGNGQTAVDIDAALRTAGENLVSNPSSWHINKILKSISAQSVSNPWIVTLQRSSELKLDQFAISDFNGGLGGFLGSLGVNSGSGGYFEESSFRTRWNSAAGAIISVRTPGSTAGVFNILPQALAGPDSNDLKDGHFKHLNAVGAIPALWNVATNATTAWSSNVNMQDWSGTGNDVLWSHMAGITNGEVVDQYADLIASQAGVTYESSVYAAQHRGRAELYVQYLDENKNHLAWAQMGGAARESGAYQGDINNFNLLSGTSVAPAGTAYRRVMLRLVSNGGNEPYAFFTRPTTREVVAGAATPNWEDTGHSVYIDNMSQVGYNTSGSSTTGNDVIDRSGRTSDVSIDDVNVSLSGDDIFIGGQGNDTINGRSGWDWLDGGAGNDTIYGGTENDIVIGGSGNDSLFGEGGDDYLAAVSGADWLRGGDGNDTLVGGTGGDVLVGGNGNDTLLLVADQSWNWYWGGGDFNFTDDAASSDAISAERFTVGVRYDLDLRPADWNSNADSTVANPASRLAEVYNNATNQWLTSSGLINIESGTGSQFADTIYGTVGANTLKGLAGNDILNGRDGNDVLEGGVGTDDLQGGNGIDTASYESSSQGVRVNMTTGKAFGGDAEGDTWSSIENLRGSKLSDELKGSATQNNIQGLAGDDWIVATASGNVTQSFTTIYNPYSDEPIVVPNGWNGGDIYDGGLGSDTVDYSEATAGIAAYLGAFNILSTGNTANPGSGSAGLAQGHIYIGIENIVGTAYNDSLSGGAGAHTFEGGKGNDALNGGGGADIYLFSRGDGLDTITETNTDNNTLSFGSDIKYSDLYIESSGGASGWLNVGIRGTTDKVAIASNFATLTNNKMKTLDIGGASQLDISQITFQVSGGTDGNNTLNGTGNYDWIFGFNGNDTITGSGSYWEDIGNIIIGGLGNDAISTSAGDDQFAYDRGDGFDTITDTGGEDTLVLGATAKADDVIYQVMGDDLYIGLKDLTDATKTASQVADKIKVIGGAVKTTVHNMVEVFGYDPNGDPYYHYEPAGDTVTINTVEYVLAGGTSIDLRKLDIAWKAAEAWNYIPWTPIALDLDGDGLNLSTVDASEVVVKTAGGGLSKVAWVGPTDGFLAVDRDGDGKINKLSEISFTQDKPGATSDLEGLKTWDTNGDGLLNSRDANFNKILLWVDANQNGRSTTRELRTLTEAGIAAIDLNGVATGYTAAMGIDSFVQNTMKFIWADSSQGNAYDVALARRVLGSEGLYAGDYQAEWGASNSDGTMGRLMNDPKTAAKAARIAAKKGLLDKIGASYQEVKAKAQVDFSDTDVVDAKVAKRWAKIDKSAQAAWLSGQVIQTDASVVAVSALRALQTTSEAAQQATRDLVNTAYSHAAASVSDGIGLDATGNVASASTGSISTSQGAAELGSLSVTASEPDLGVAGYAGTGATSQTQAWWRSEAQNDSAYRSSSLSNLLSAMDTSMPDQGWGQPSDDAMAQQQLLLRQSMAAFGGTSGGSPAVWNRDAFDAVALAASTGLQAHAQSGFVSAVA
ncbi:hypothetical protein ABENE_13265 [Asticcacaulis benevestitus DSM 16100 = ATCC BAA-896]|uniref:Uncharacterized protein n=2 Tax=Asticcacaulis TaxID=76890 RepID=V4PRK9_9CAUL|nr:hypothetical protein ABENE_13265 [Asticcacaulis benevestitus DSM 16100 = ATCC BAA-896]